MISGVADNLPSRVRLAREWMGFPSARFEVGIYSSRSPYLATETDHVVSPVSIGDDVIAFSNVVIGPGVAIGDRAVVAAGAVVLDDVPAGILVGGTPAKVLRAGVR